MSTVLSVNGTTYIWPDDFSNYGFLGKFPALIGDCLAQFGSDLASAAASAAAALASQVAAAASAAAALASQVAAAASAGAAALSATNAGNAAATATAQAGIATNQAGVSTNQAAIATNQAAAAAASATGAASAAVAAASNALSATTTDTLTITTGTLAFTVGAGKSFLANQWVVASYNPYNYVAGQVVGYAGAILTVNVNSTAGGGTYSSWTVVASGPTGATGPSASGVAMAYLSANYTAAGNAAYLCDTSGGPFAVTLPGAPGQGQSVRIVDARESFAANNLTLGLNGKSLIVTQKSSVTTVTTNLVLDLAGTDLTVWYDGGNWRTL